MAGDVSSTGFSPDPLTLGAMPPGLGGDLDAANTLPPFGMLHSGMTTSPPIATIQAPTLSLDIDRRIKQSEDLLNRMVRTKRAAASVVVSLFAWCRCWQGRCAAFPVSFVFASGRGPASVQG